MLRAVALALRARLRELRWLREIFLIAQPPLLIQGGEFALSEIVLALSKQPQPRRGIRVSDDRSHLLTVPSPVLQLQTR